MKAIEFVVALAVGALTVLGATGRILDRTGQFPQPLSVFLLQGRSFLEESGKVLVRSANASHYRGV